MFFGIKRYLLIVAVAFSAVCVGQSTFQLKFDHYDLNNGLGSINVRKVLQDSKGLMWIATQDGLYRFDGKSFTPYNKLLLPKYALSGSDIRDILEDRNVLWTISSFGGIDAIDIITGHVVYQLNQQTDKRLKHVLLSSLAINGDSLFVGSDKGLFCLNIRNKELVLVRKDKLLGNNFSLPNIDKLLFDSNHRLWMLCENQGVYVVDPNRFNVLGSYRDSSIAFYDCDIWNNSIVAATSKGIRLYSFESGQVKDNSRRFDAVSEGKNVLVFAVKTDKEGNLWFSNRNNLIKVDALLKSYMYIKESKVSGKDWTTAVFGIYFDHASNLWIGCQAGLAFSNNKPAAFLSFYKSRVSQEVINHSYYLYPCNDSVVLVCGEDALYEVNERSGVIKAIDKGKSYFYAFEGFGHKLIVSNDKGLFVMEKNRLIPMADVYSEFQPFGTILINSHIVIGDSICLFGSQNRRGFFIWKFKAGKIDNVTAESDSVRLSDNNINTIYKDKRGIIWILADNSVSLYDLNRNSIRTLSIVNPQNDKTYNIFYDVCEINGFYYVATYVEGIIVLDRNFQFVRNISTREQLANNSVYKLLPYKDSLLFATTNNGLSVIDLSNSRIKNYYDVNGLHSSVFEELSGNVRNDIIYAGGKDGFSIIKPALFSANSTPPFVFVKGLKIETSDRGIIDHSDLSENGFFIPNNAIQTTVYFSGLNYTNPSLTTFAYRLQEISDNWTAIGKQNFANLIGISPGTYHLQVKAANEDGVWSEPIEFTLIFLPKWYQTWWFKSMVALLLMGILYGLYRFRLSQIRKEQQIRQRIASDLHDDIGSTLNSVKVFTNLAIMKPENNISYLEQLKEGVQGAIVGVRDMVWVLDDKQDTFDHLVSRIELFINPLASAQHIVFEKSVDATLADRMLRKEEKRNLYLIIKEALNNSIKYSSASMLQLRIYKSLHDKCCIAIQDNGVGFDLASVQRGNGLDNLQFRAQQIKYRIEIKTAPGKGTLIILSKS